jgi:hypothetical protein
MGGQPQLVHAIGRQEHFMPRGRGPRHRLQQPVDRPQLAGKAQLTIALERRGSARLELARGQQQPERNRQVEASALFFQLDRSQVDGDAPGRKIVA